MGYIETWGEVMQSPSDFYRDMPKTGGILIRLLLQQLVSSYTHF